MPPPENYNSNALSLTVDPLELWRYATVDLTAQATVVADAIVRISKIWQGLELGWAGDTADEAEDFGRRWVAAITGLFGTESDPESGALGRLQKAASLAAINYAVAEDTVWRMFTEHQYASDGYNTTELDNNGNSIHPEPNGAPYPGYHPNTDGVTPPHRDSDDGPFGINTPE